MKCCAHYEPARTEAEEQQLLAVARAAGPGTDAWADAAGRGLGRHRGLIVQVCQRAVMDGFEIDDAIQEAYIAGLDAVKYYRAEKGFKFSTYLLDSVRRRVWKWRSERKWIPLPQENDGGEETEKELLPAPTEEPVDLAADSEEWSAMIGL